MEQTSQSLEELIASIDRETLAGQNRLPGAQALEKKLSPAAGRRQRYVRIYLNDTLFGISLKNAVEIGQLTNITPLPNLPFWACGISNIRGEIVSIIDLQGFFEWPTSAVKLGRTFIVVESKGVKVGLLVDRVMGILSLDPETTPVQEMHAQEGVAASFVKGVVTAAEHTLNIFDLDRFLSSPKMTAFR